MSSNNKPDAPPPRFRYRVVQGGARRGYAVPLILERAGMLESFHTDVCGNAGWGAWLVKVASVFGIGGRLDLLARRKVPEEVVSKSHTYAVPSLRWAWRRWLQRLDEEAELRLHMRRVLETGDRISRHDFRNATHLYMMHNEFPNVMRKAREMGLKVVSEVYILQSTGSILKEERKLFPDWEDEAVDVDAISVEMSGEDVLFTQVDHYLCPSDFVRDDLVKNWGVDEGRTSVVPYGMAPAWLDIQQKPVTGRLLFVGTADLRKGIHYLAFAAEELKRRGRNYEFRVAGNVSDRIRNRPECRELTFLGRVPRDQIQDEFRQADVFVLPSLAEGSAEVTYEALACGLPIVTTRAAGSVARDGLDAIIVPERNVTALADAVECIVEDRALRENLSGSARAHAFNYTWERYGKRLVETLKSIG